MAEKMLLRIKEVEEILSVRRGKVYELIHNGKLKAVAMNGSGKKGMFVLRESIKPYLESIAINPEDFIY
jgi:excisionase family DNA binding protein